MASKYAIETIFRAIDRITAPVDKMGKKMNKFGAIGNSVNAGLKKGFVNAEKSLAKIGQAAKKAIAGLAVTAVISAGAFAATGVKNMMEYETGLAKIGTIADKSVMSIRQISDGILKLSKATGVSVNEIAEAQYQAISAGVDTVKSLDFVSVAVKAAKGGFTDTAIAVDALSTVLNAYQLSANDAIKISDQMLVAQNLGKTTFGDMASSIGNVIPIAASLKVGTEELFASIAALTAAGIQTPQVITGLKAAFSNIQKPSKTASDLAKKLGIDFSAVALQSKGLAGFLKNVAKATGNDAEKMAQLFGSVEALNAMTVLTGTGAERFAGAIEAMGNAAGATDSAFKMMMDTFTERFKKIQNVIKNAGIKFGLAMAPVLDKVSIKMDALVQNFDNIDFEPITVEIGKVLDNVIWLGTAVWKLRKPILAVVGAVIAFKAAMIVTVVAVKTYNAILAVMKIVTLAIQLATQGYAIVQAVLTHNTIALSTATGAFNAILVANPIGVIILAVIALIAIIILCVKNWDKISAALRVAWDWIKKVASIIWDSLVGAFRACVQWVSNVASAFSGMLLGALKKVWTPIQNIVTAFTGGGIIAGLKQIGATILSVIVSPLQYMLDLLSKIPGIGGKFSGINDGIDNVIDSLSIATPEILPLENNQTAGGAPLSGFGPITQGERAAYSRSESISRSEMTIGLEKGLTAQVSGPAPGITVRTAKSGAF